jgi:hypothetical protein
MTNPLGKMFAHYRAKSDWEMAQTEDMKAERR